MEQQFKENVHNAVWNIANNTPFAEQRIEVVRGDETGEEQWAYAAPARGGFTLAEAYALIRERYES